MISKTLYNIAALFFLIKGISGVIQINVFAVESAATTGHAFPLTIYISPVLFILAGLACWYISSFTGRIISEEEASPLSEHKSFSLGLCLLGLFFLGNHFPELVEKYIQYKEFMKIGMVGESLAGPTSGLWVLGAKSCFGLILVLLSLNSKAVFYAIKKLGA